MPFGFWEIKRKGSLPKARIIMSRVAGLFLGVDFTAWNYSIFYVGAGIGAILLNLQVIVVPMLSAIFDKWLGKKQKQAMSVTRRTQSKTNSSEKASLRDTHQMRPNPFGTKQAPPGLKEDCDSASYGSVTTKS